VVIRRPVIDTRHSCRNVAASSLLHPHRDRPTDRPTHRLVFINTYQVCRSAASFINRVCRAGTHGPTRPDLVFAVVRASFTPTPTARQLPVCYTDEFHFRRANHITSPLHGACLHRILGLHVPVGILQFAGTILLYSAASWHSVFSI